MPEIIQYRNIPSPVTVRNQTRDDGPDSQVLAGVGMIYGSEYENWWGEIEVMRAGCFEESLAENTFILWSHNMANLLGSTESKTARINDTDSQLEIECDVPDTSCGHDTYELVNRGDVEGMSVGFFLQGWEIEKGSKKSDPDRFIITKADLVEVSFVANPAYKDTSAEARSAEKGSPFVRRYALNPQEKALRNRELDARLRRLSLTVPR